MTDNLPYLECNTERYLASTIAAKDLFMHMRSIMSKYGTVHAAINCGTFVSPTEFIPAMTNLKVPQPYIENRNGAGVMILSVSEGSCIHYDYDLSKRVFVFNLSFGGVATVVHIPPILIVGLYVKDHPATVSTISTYSRDEFIGVANGMAVGICPDEVYRNLFLPVHEPVGNVVSIFDKSKGKPSK